MNIIFFLLLSIPYILCANVENGPDIDIIAANTTSVTVTNSTTTTTTTPANTTTQSTTATHNTTTSATTITTSAETTTHNTTTSATTITTSAETTTHNTTTSATTITTSAETTTKSANITTPAITTTPILTTTFPPKIPATGSWHLTDVHTNETCILLKGGFRLTFHIKENDKVTTKIIDLDTSATVNSNLSFCHSNQSNYIQSLTLQMKNPFNTFDIFGFIFTSSDNLKSFSLSKVFGIFDLDSNVVINFARNNTENVKVKVGGSYECKASQNITHFASNNSNVTLISIETDNFKYEAFRRSSDNNFAAATSCSADVVISNIVPIAVGAALACLVIVVLIAYLIGRRRSRRGYESV